MLRKLSRKISHRLDGRREPSPEFVSCDAKRVEAAHKQEADKKPRASWEHGDEGRFNAHRSLEALALEPIIAPTLKRMGPTVAAREALLPPPGRPAGPAPIARPKPARLPLPVIPSGHDVLILSRPVPGITQTPNTEAADPFEGLDDVHELPIASFPERPVLRRKAVSYRTHRDLPLRVQAVRRAHQEEFSRRLAERPPIMASARRGSAPVHSRLPPRAPPPVPELWLPTAQLRPPKPLSPEESLRRVRSEAQLYQVPQRSLSAAGKARPRSPIPDVPPEGPEAAEHDYYIESASHLWRLPTR